ncbi:hypothetical protein Dimus_031828 [Dionaea muscipula]
MILEEYETKRLTYQSLRADFAFDLPYCSEAVISSGMFVENANAADIIQRRQRSEFLSSIRSEGLSPHQ